VKIGNLVELSASGKKLTCNYSQQGSVGLVVKVDVKRGIVEPCTAVSIKWAGSATPIYHMRKDLKYVSR